MREVTVDRFVAATPVEVERARTSWVDTENRLIAIPARESAKNEEHWRVSITDRTADALNRWLVERERL
jgi:integrase